MKRIEILKNHTYNVWQGKDSAWRTYLPDPMKGRRLVKKKTKEAVEDAIVDYYKETERLGGIENATLRSLYPVWKEWKSARTDSPSYIKRICADWQKFYEKDEISDIPIIKLDKVGLDTWAHTKIKDYSLTKKSYYNMSVIIRQILEYAKEQGIIEHNKFSDVKINSKLFVRAKKPKSETQVFLNDEKPKLIEDMIRRYKKNPESTAPLAVILDFEIGVRIGELLCIKTTDIDETGNYLTIQRQEIRNYVSVGDYDMKLKGFKVVDHPKTSDGYREIYLTKSNI